VAKTCRKAQLRGQQLPAKKGKVRAKLTQTSQIQDWDSLTPEQQQETLDWGIDIDVSSDSDKGMATATFMQTQTAGGSGGGSGSGTPEGGGGGGGGPPGGGGHGPPAVPPTLDELNWLMADLGNIVGILAQQVVDLTRDRAGGRGGSAKDLVSKPKPWDGRGGSAEARHFLAAFHNYAASQGSPLNTYDPTANTWTINEERWIQSVLNLMEGDARTWALPYLEELRTGTIPFNGLWATFVDHFSRRFAPLDTADAARDALKKVRQKNSTVAEYTSLFDQYSAQTGWSLVNLRQRYYNGLNDRVKDRLSEIPTPPADLADLWAAAQNINQRWQQREAEKKGGTITISLSQGTQSDPNAMQVDAMRQGNQKPKEVKKDRTS
jgi:hypothetical protein